jgi:hypothetical protein
MGTDMIGVHNPGMQLGIVIGYPRNPESPGFPGILKTQGFFLPIDFVRFSNQI